MLEMELKKPTLATFSVAAYTHAGGANSLLSTDA